jgi:hypothetical protein
VKDYLERTPLHLAAVFNRFEYIRLLITMKKDVKVVDCWNRTPLHHACREGHLDFAKAFMDECKQAFDDDELVDELVNADADYGESPMGLALKGWNVKLIKLFTPYFEDKPTLELQQMFSIHSATITCNFDMLEFMVQVSRSS